MDTKEFGRRLKKYRGKTSQEKLGELLGYGQTYISSLEKGLSNPSIELLDKLVKITRITSSYWLGEIDEAIPIEDLASLFENAGKNAPPPSTIASNKKFSAFDMELDSLSSFFRDRVKHEICTAKDSTFKRVREDVEELRILLEDEQREKNDR
ncbi:helix-turn-helix transcriptional regulator [Cloacibacillus sp.]|uniref:helix-turn-helix domain-containing protein n=1 Tax=Cloacibacillus sp. TaxID=2049023 RepID=UPI0025B9536B|nr:helix-turn-helix transcriptional regulator [Cloacibacillus sp.]MCC8058302.1 helix-turn-helix domain-containing protein [Cloacibacillus sp.]